MIYKAIYLQTFPFLKRLSVKQIQSLLADQSFELIEVKHKAVLSTSYGFEDSDPVYIVLNGKIVLKQHLVD